MAVHGGFVTKDEEVLIETALIEIDNYDNLLFESLDKGDLDSFSRVRRFQG